ncbi:MAG: four helix bundle protein [Acidobacteria bacterium]|nr:four helix bundle protein [Acidobacteriota bacterium]MBI3427070.1 four helix bundle protein [Acidobacteriota bacterium]
MAEKKDNPVLDKSFKFALRIVKLYKYLTDEKREFVLSKFLLTAGTLIGARVETSQAAVDRNAFSSELNMALQKAKESEYWLKLLLAGEFLTQAEYDSIFADADELVSLLTKIVKTSRGQS